MEDELGERAPGSWFRVLVIVAALRERAYESGLAGDRASATERCRSGALVVLCSWTLFVIAGAAFSKVSEHADAAVPTSARWLVGGSIGCMKMLAAVAGLAVVAGAVTASDPFIRFARMGGWPSVHGVVLTAGGLSAVAGAGAAGLIVWAHHLSAVDRESGAWPYGPAFLTSAALVAIALVAWSAAAVVAARRTPLAARQLRLASALAVVVAAAMVLMTAAAAVWWATVATHAPWFLHASRPGSSKSAFDARLGVILLLMALADVVAGTGVARIQRARTSLAVR